VGNVIESFGVRHQQHADDTQLYLSMPASDSAQELDVLRSCSTAVRDCYLSNNLLLNADKSQAIVLGTANQLRSATSIDSVEVAGVALPVATTLKSLGVILDQRLTFNEHASRNCSGQVHPSIHPCLFLRKVKSEIWSCNYHARAIRHVRHYVD